MRGATTQSPASTSMTSFQSTPLMRGATCRACPDERTYEFQSTPLMRGATDCVNIRDAPRRFQSTPLMRGATAASSRRLPDGFHFNPRSSCEGRPERVPSVVSDCLFQSTPLMRGATRRPLRCRAAEGISIHAPHARGDRKQKANTTNEGDFNPRPSCEGRLMIMFTSALRLSFQSTPLMRGATDDDPGWLRHRAISIHAPHARGDACACGESRIGDRFQSTPLMRGATMTDMQPEARATISIHAPHARGDLLTYLLTNQLTRFQSTPLMRGATLVRELRSAVCVISIHAPHARGDIGEIDGRDEGRISIHAPHARGDCAR